MSKNETMSLIDHIGELRKRIIWVIAVLAATMIGGLFAAKPVLEYLKNVEPAKGIAWNAFSPWDAIGSWMQVAFVISLAVSLPFALFQFWLFVKPGLHLTEQTAAGQYIPVAFLFLVLGLAFAYFIVFPMAFSFASTVTRSLDLEETYGIAQYFSFMFNILIPMSLLFELPIIIMFLTKIRVLNPKRLGKMRRYAYVVLVIIATVVTPPDLISDLLVAIPLIILYEISVLLSQRVYRKQQEAAAADEFE